MQDSSSFSHLPIYDQHCLGSSDRQYPPLQSKHSRGYRSPIACISPPAFQRLSHLPTQYEKIIIIRHCFDRDKVVVQIVLLISQRCMIMFHIWLCAF